MDELLNSKYNYFFLPDKYTADEFMVIYNERVNKLYEDLPNLKTEDIDQRFSHLYEDCPIGLLIDNFSLEEKLDNDFPGWNKWNILGGTGEKRKFVIPVGKLTENEEKSLLEKIKNIFKREK